MLLPRNKARQSFSDNKTWGVGDLWTKQKKDFEVLQAVGRAEKYLQLVQLYKQIQEDTKTASCNPFYGKIGSMLSLLLHYLMLLPNFHDSVSGHLLADVSSAVPDGVGNLHNLHVETLLSTLIWLLRSRSSTNNVLHSKQPWSEKL